MEPDKERGNTNCGLLCVQKNVTKQIAKGGKETSETNSTRLE